MTIALLQSGNRRISDEQEKIRAAGASTGGQGGRESMIHLGDITKMPFDTPPVDCITFGSPCQDLSIAGNRAGLAGERSGLFMSAVKVIKNMLVNTFGQYPKFAVWENVPGAFSSNKGEDFRVILEELARIKSPEVSIPRPDGGKWAKAGLIAGYGWSIAWRTFGAQFWGVPQRRKRIALVMDFGGHRAGEILFERQGVSGYLEPSIPPWQGIARNPATSVDEYDQPIAANFYSRDIDETVCAAFTAGQVAKANGIGWAEEQAPTLRTDDGLSAMPTVLCRAHGQANAETLTECSPTLNCNHEQPIVFESHSQDARYTQQGSTSPACTAQWGTGGNNMPLVAFSKETYNAGQNASCSMGIESTDLAPTVRADTHPGGIAYHFIRWIVRRLTPTECERLQGFPDGWTNIPEWVDSRGKLHKAADSPRYKALGNSIALPQWWWITCKMAFFLPEHATLGSLFDGIGGFPLVWETRHGKGTAVWASEIEPFPIAVTKYHFGGAEMNATTECAKKSATDYKALLSERE